MTIPRVANPAVEAGQPGALPSAKTLATKDIPNAVPASIIDIIDIRHDAVELNLKDEILSSLRPETGIKKLPTLLLYSERGLQLFEEVGISIWIAE
jgi:hypothetical protein